MANVSGPYQIEYQLDGWTSPTRSHVMRVNCLAVGSPAVGTPPAGVTMQKMGGGTATLQAVADQLWSFLRLSFPAAVVCSGFTLWHFPGVTEARDFITAGAVATPAGATGSVQQAQQTTLTFRSANGGIMKFVFLESNSAGDTRVALIPNAAGSSFQRLAAYVMSADNICIADDDGFPVTALRISQGQNERVWRKLFRAS